MSRSNPRRAFGLDDALAPGAPKFGEAWHAQVLAIADTLVTSGRIAAADWARALGAELRRDEATADTDETYYKAALRALESLLDHGGIIDQQSLSACRDAWENAYLNTPHGAPVTLENQTE